MADPVTVFIGGTIIFFVLWFLFSLILSRYVKSNIEDEQDKSTYGRMTIYYVTIAAVVMYLMWLCVFLHQLHPLIIPDLETEIAKEVAASHRDDLVSGL